MQHANPWIFSRLGEAILQVPMYSLVLNQFPTDPR
jgi:hypothetical protein